MLEENLTASVLIPVRNEEEHIKECLNSLVNQDYPEGEYEILVVDGMSEDRTRDIIKEMMEDHKNIRLLDNPELNTAVGRNIGAKEASGDIVIEFAGGHSYAQKNFVSTLVSKLEQADDSVAAVGCGHETPKEDPFLAKAIGFVMSSKFGGFGTTFRHPDKEQFVDSLAFVAYRKEVLKEVGMYDSHFWTGQDAELNLRIRKAGYKLLYTPDTKAYHHKKGSLTGFFKRMFNYGIARMRMVKKHRDSFKIIHALPTLFILALISFGVLSFFSYIPFILFLFATGGYSICLISSAAYISSKHGLNYFPSLIAAYFSEHFAYGLGYLMGIFGRRFHWHKRTI